MEGYDLQTFKRLLQSLDDLIEDEIQHGNTMLRSESPLVVKSVGGFALLYYGARVGSTQDIDNTTRHATADTCHSTEEACSIRLDKRP